MKKEFSEICAMIDWPDDFWNPTKFLTMRDRSGGPPGVFASVSNRTGGKTYGICLVLMKYHFETDGEIGLICKTQDDLGVIANGVFGKVMEQVYPEWKLEEKISKTKKFSEMILKKNVGTADEPDYVCRKLGWVLCLNGARRLKDFSSMISSVDILFFDEFQGDTYLPNEIEKMILLIGSVSRGTETGVRHVPLIMCSNSLSIENPYFVAFGVVSKLQSDTHFYRGEGLVIERFMNEAAAEKQKALPTTKAFSNSPMMKTSVDNSWLNDDYACVCKPTKDWGRSVYMSTLIDGDLSYGVRKYENGYYYINRSIDKTCQSIYAISVDGLENASLLRTATLFEVLRKNFARGNVRFSDLTVKNIIYKFFT